MRRVKFLFHTCFFEENGSLWSETLPDEGWKLPIGLRMNYFADDHFVIKTFYRYYKNNWGITAHTAEFEIPVKIDALFSTTPFYRHNNQVGTRYVPPYGQHSPSDQNFTSDYDLSTLTSDFYVLEFALRRLKVFLAGKDSICLN